MTRVFVFGTLKEGFPNFATNRGRRLPGEYRTCDALPLFLVGERYSPWLLDAPGKGRRVAGQVFEVDAGTLADMDVLERVDAPDGYRRVALAVERRDGTPDGGQRLTVFAYLKPAQALTPDLPRIGPLDDYSLAHAALYRKRP